jgi:hypothetical protein
MVIRPIDRFKQLLDRIVVAESVMGPKRFRHDQLEPHMRHQRFPTNGVRCNGRCEQSETPS